MKYHTLFFLKIGKMFQNMSPAAVVIALCGLKSSIFTHVKINNFLTLCTLGIFHALLSSADFFFEITFFEKFFQEYHLSVKYFGSRSGPTYCRA